jgi:hypothetical protein
VPAAVAGRIQRREKRAGTTTGHEVRGLAPGIGRAGDVGTEVHRGGGLPPHHVDADAGGIVRGRVRGIEMEGAFVLNGALRCSLENLHMRLRTFNFSF